MEPKYLTRKDGKFLEARVIVEKGEVNQGNLAREFSVVVDGNEINPRDLAHYGTETISIRYDTCCGLREAKEPQMNEELFAKGLDRAKELGADYAFLEGVSMQYYEPCKEIKGTLNLYVERNK